MHKPALAGVLVLLLACPAPGRAAIAGVVFQISTTQVASWKMAMHNVHNLEATGVSGHDIEMVILGPAIHILLKSSPVAPSLTRLHATGVTIDACRAAIRRARLAPGAILPFVRYVHSGIAEVVRRERQGWAYIRP